MITKSTVINFALHATLNIIPIKYFKVDQLELKNKKY